MQFSKTNQSEGFVYFYPAFSTQETHQILFQTKIFMHLHIFLFTATIHFKVIQMLKIPDIVYELYLHVAWESCELYKFQQNGRNMSTAATQKHFFRLCQISHL